MIAAPVTRSYEHGTGLATTLLASVATYAAGPFEAVDGGGAGDSPVQQPTWAVRRLHMQVLPKVGEARAYGASIDEAVSRYSALVGQGDTRGAAHEVIGIARDLHAAAVRIAAPDIDRVLAPMLPTRAWEARGWALALTGVRALPDAPFGAPLAISPTAAFTALMGAVQIANGFAGAAHTASISAREAVARLTASGHADHAARMRAAKDALDAALTALRPEVVDLDHGDIVAGGGAGAQRAVSTAWANEALVVARRAVQHAHAVADALAVVERTAMAIALDV